MVPRCIFCGDPIDPDRDERMVKGFERRRSQGGTNAIRLREPVLDDDGHEIWACRFCVDRQVKGVSVHQGALL